MLSITARCGGMCSQRCSFEEAEKWFRGDSTPKDEWLSAQVPAECLWEAEQFLNTARLDLEFHALLPYILEEHGPGSRASVLKNPSTASARAAKRETGIFYTPADVADYMVGHAKGLYGGNFLTAKSLDPACGTGVFLLAMLRAAKHAKADTVEFSSFEYITSCLYGMDIDGHALDAAAFVLLNECLPDVLASKCDPLPAWKQIRRNLVETDTIRVGSDSIGKRKAAADFFEDTWPDLAKLFPTAHGGFDIMVGNPPYAALGKREDFAALTARFASLGGSKEATELNLFPLFVEMMWQFTKPGCSAAALVIPLSLAFRSGLQFENCRYAMSWSGGRWQFAFFDREPHALFGEEVKTRNAIVFRSENLETPERGRSANIETGPLRKWTSRTRDEMFRRIKFTPVDSIEITAGIPKLGGDAQAEAFMALRRRVDRLPQYALHIGKSKPADALKGEIAPKVYVGATAYNFLNVYRPTRRLPKEQGIVMSESPVHCLDFKSEVEARAAFAILSSRISFWLWHVLGDGFHVATWLFNEIPFNGKSFTTADFESLGTLGDALWRKIQGNRFTSLNAGRMTVGFRPLSCHHERDAIDAILVRSAGLSNGFLKELQAFVEQNAVVDPADDRRRHVSKHFTKIETE